MGLEIDFPTKSPVFKSILALNTGKLTPNTKTYGY